MKREVWVKNVKIGGDGAISIQSMTNTSTHDIKATLAQINNLQKIGADMVRVSVPDNESVVAFGEIVKATSCPLIADIHYDYKLALKAMEAGAHKIRINPSNISKQGIREVAKLAKERQIPIRVGVNQGSVQRSVSPHILAHLAMDSAKLLEDEGFFDIVLAVKSSSVDTTVKAYRELHKISDYPLHIGLTEAGTVEYGMIKSSVAIGSLLLDGIGNTLRVSLTDEPEQEVLLAKKILRAVGIDKNYVEIISCPTCARTAVSVSNIANELQTRVAHIKKPIKIAVMGCTVNGIGESKDADFGVCGGKDKSMIFYQGKAIKTVDNHQVITELLSILERY